MNSKFLAFGMLALLVLFAGCAQQSQAPPANTGGNPGGNGSTASVEIKSFAFLPAELTIAKGTTVTWTNNDSVAHTATGDNGEFDTGTIAVGSTASFTFNTAGTFNYHCSIHTMMKAKIIVTG